MINKKEIQTVITLFCLFFLLFGIIGCTGDGDIPPSPEEGKCELENPNPAEEHECQTSCEGSCSEDWHLEGSCQYSCPGFWPWQWFRKCDGGYCCPDSCDDMGGYTCEDGEVCPGDWLSPLTGEERCCFVECVLPCGNYDDKTSSTSGLNYCTELGLDSDDLMDDLETDMNSAGVQALIDEGGIAICLDICFDLKYAVEGESEDSTWCQECAVPPAEKCCIYCPPQTVHYEEEGCGPTKATPCGDASGLPYSDPMQGGSADDASYVENGFSVCQTECAEITGSLENIWTGTNIEGGNQWCKEMYGGTDYEDNVKCCAYCPPKTVYSNGECKSCECEPGENLTVTLDCPYVLLAWSSEENIEYYQGVTDFNIRPFYDDDNDKTADGFCKEVKTTRMEYAYNLELSECTDHLQHNIRFLISPRDTSLKSILTDWIDVSICNIGGKIEDCTNGIDDDGDGLKDCEDSYDCPDGKICSEDGTKVCRGRACVRKSELENCTNNEDDDGDGLIDCKDTANCPEGTICNEEGTETCQLEICKLTESELGLEEEEEHNADSTGTKDDFDDDGTLNDEDSDKDGD
ncbi:MAG: hypothetical protein KKF74_01645, partial [Nanoarchaeota archaeon]|nr:hypothetical protein [Nanoarchaeota archaeon]